MGPVAAAVYQIKHLASGRCYVGSTANLEVRWRGHRYDLARGKHHSRFLQRAWDKYGPDAFEFTVLERCDKALLLVREQFWIDRLQPIFNTCPVAGSSIGRKMSAEAVARLRARMLGTKRPPRSPEWCAKLSAALTGKHPAPEAVAKMRATKTGKPTRPCSPEKTAKISAAQRGRPLEPEHVEKLKIAAQARWSNPEARLQMSAAKRGRPTRPCPPEVREKIGAAQRGRPFSPGHIANIRAAHVRQWEN
jgi:group I intron endonuclease